MARTWPGVEEGVSYGTPALRAGKTVLTDKTQNRLPTHPRHSGCPLGDRHAAEALQPSLAGVDRTNQS